MEVRHGKNSLTRFIAGIVLVSAAVLTLTHSSYWAFLTMIVGVTHITSSIFGFCPLELFLHRILRMPVRGQD